MVDKKVRGQLLKSRRMCHLARMGFGMRVAVVVTEVRSDPSDGMGQLQRGHCKPLGGSASFKAKQIRAEALPDFTARLGERTTPQNEQSFTREHKSERESNEQT